MKKIFLMAIALLTMATTQVFGMYGVDTDWINFLTHGNQFRARLDQLGFTLGNDMIKGTFGFDNNTGYGGTYGALLSGNTTETLPNGDATAGNHYYDWIPSISMGIGYTSSLIGVGVGYNVTIGTDRYRAKADSIYGNEVTHTPVLVLNALDNAFRMAIPIQVFVKNQELGGVKTKEEAVSVDSQFRYYSGLEMLPQVRLYLRYGYYGYDNGNNNKGKYAESFGFDFRVYFGSMVEEVALQPIVRLAYNGALGKQHNNRRIEAVKAMNNSTGYTSLTSTYGTSAWDIKLLTALGLTANSDIVSLYFEPSIGLDITQAGNSTQKVKETYGLGYDVYAEIYITPLKNLEWYFEASIGGDTTKALTFAGTTGITWYLPAL